MLTRPVHLVKRATGINMGHSVITHLGGGSFHTLKLICCILKMGGFISFLPLFGFFGLNLFYLSCELFPTVVPLLQVRPLKGGVRQEKSRILCARYLRKPEGPCYVRLLFL